MAAKPDREASVNPDHNRPLRETDEELSAWLHRYHRASGSIELYYELYPMQRPPESERTPEPEPAAKRGRSR